MTQLVECLRCVRGGEVAEFERRRYAAAVWAQMDFPKQRSRYPGASYAFPYGDGKRLLSGMFHSGFMATRSQRMWRSKRVEA